MGITERVTTTYRVTCDINNGCGAAAASKALSRIEAGEIAVADGFTYTWTNSQSARIWICPQCQEILCGCTHKNKQHDANGCFAEDCRCLQAR